MKSNSFIRQNLLTVVASLLLVIGVFFVHGDNVFIVEALLSVVVGLWVLKRLH